MNTLQSPQLPRQFATGSVIAFLHIALLGLIILNPVKHMQSIPKETLVMMIPSMLPKPVTPVSKEVKATNPRHATAPVIPQFATQHTTENTITVAPVTSDLTPPAVSTLVAAAPVIAKTEATGPKVISAVEYIQAPQADYPPMARRMGEEGRVIMQVLVNDKGRAEKVEILKSSGFARLDESAKVALLRALFKPYFEDGKATMVLATASINFSLRG